MLVFVIEIAFTYRLWDVPAYYTVLGGLDNQEELTTAATKRRSGYLPHTTYLDYEDMHDSGFCDI
jgi:hypothetical protein